MIGETLVALIATMAIGVNTATPSVYYYTNEENVCMTKSQYELLETLGFDDDEIATMSVSKFEKLSAMEVLKTEKTISTMTLDEVSVSDSDENTDEIAATELEMTDEELLAEAELTEADMFALNDKVVSSDDVSYTESDIEVASYEANSSEKKYSTSDSTKTMVTYVSYIKVDNEYKIYTKQNVTWSSVPTERYSDLLSINYTDNIRVGEANNYPDVEIHLKYTKQIYNKTGWKRKKPKYTVKTTTKTVDNAYDGSNTGVYNHKIGDYFAFKADLPKNTSMNGSSQRYYLIQKVTYYDFSVSLEATFDTNIANLTGTELQSYYVHQTGSGTIDWGKLTFTTTAPYITYSTSFWIDDPTFETGMYNRIYLKF